MHLIIKEFHFLKGNHFTFWYRNSLNYSFTVIGNKLYSASQHIWTWSLCLVLGVKIFLWKLKSAASSLFCWQAEQLALVMRIKVTGKKKRVDEESCATNFLVKYVRFFSVTLPNSKKSEESWNSREKSLNSWINIRVLGPKSESWEKTRFWD